MTCQISVMCLRIGVIKSSIVKLHTQQTNVGRIDLKQQPAGSDGINGSLERLGGMLGLFGFSKMQKPSTRSRFSWLSSVCLVFNSRK